MDLRKKTSSKNGRLGGRPAKPDMNRVVSVLLRGLKRLAKEDQPVYEVVVSLAQKRVMRKAEALTKGFDEVIAHSRAVYLGELQKLQNPNPVEVREALIKKLEQHARTARESLAIIAVKADIAIKDIEEQSLSVDSNTMDQLKKLSQLKIDGLDQVVSLILGVIEETTDQFGIPIYS